MDHFLSISETSTDTLRHVLDVAFELRAKRKRGELDQGVLAHQTLAMIFEKPSLRTRVSFEQAMLELGGHAIVLGAAEVGLGTRECPADIARVLSGMVHGLMARVFEHQKLVDLVAHSSIPIINALSDESHPCQALADVMTLMDEFGRDLTGRTLAYVGDGNNVARSLARICCKLGIRINLATPAGYSLDEPFVQMLRSQPGGDGLTITHDANEAVADADAVYTDTWVSMGQEDEKQHRRAAFAGYQVNAQMVKRALPHAVVLHCLPAYRGVEITDEVMDGPRSRVFPQAHNRLHAQKGLLAVLMGKA